MDFPLELIINPICNHQLDKNSLHEQCNNPNYPLFGFYEKDGDLLINIPRCHCGKVIHFSLLATVNREVQQLFNVAYATCQQNNYTSFLVALNEVCGHVDQNIPQPLEHPLDSSNPVPNAQDHEGRFHQGEGQHEMHSDQEGIPHTQSNPAVMQNIPNSTKIEENINPDKNNFGEEDIPVEGIATRVLPGLPQRHNPSSTPQAANQPYIPPNTEEEIKFDKDTMCVVHSQLRSPYEYICEICNKKGCVACYENPGHCDLINKHKFVSLSQSTLINFLKEHHNIQKNKLNNEHQIAKDYSKKLKVRKKTVNKLIDEEITIVKDFKTEITNHLKAESTRLEKIKKTINKNLEDFNSTYQKQIPSIQHSTDILDKRINYYIDKIRTNEITDINQIKKELNTYIPVKDLIENVETQTSRLQDLVIRKRNNYLNEMKGNFVKSLNLSQYAAPPAQEIPKIIKEQNIMDHHLPNQPIPDRKPALPVYNNVPQFDYPLSKIPDIPNIKISMKISDLEQEYQYSESARKQIKSLKTKGFVRFREIRGDGNCYYRAVYYAYLEKLIVTEKLERFLQKMLLEYPDSMPNLFGLDYPEVDLKKILTQKLQNIHITSIQEGKKEALQELMKYVLIEDEFDQGCIFFLKLLIKNLLFTQSEKKINNLSLNEAIKPDAKDLPEFIDEILLKKQSEARGLILSLLPIVLRINININTLRPQDKITEQIFEEQYLSRVDTLSLEFGDGLDFHNSSINVLFTTEHYDILYSYVDQIPEDYDLKFQKFMDQIQEKQHISNKIELPCCHQHIDKEYLYNIVKVHNPDMNLRCPKCNQIVKKIELKKVLGIKIEEEAGNGREKCAECRKWINKGEEYFFPCSHLIHQRCFTNVKKKNKCPTCGMSLGLKQLPELEFQVKLETEEDQKRIESVKNLLEEIVNIKKEKELLIDLISDNNIHTISGTQIREIISYLVPTPNYHNTMEERKGTYSVYFYESSYLNKSGRHNQVALKVIPLPPINKEIKIQNLRLEFTSAFRCLLSPHIVRPISMCVNQNYVGILMEDGGMPIHELWRQVNWSTQYSFPAFLQLTKGLKHIHSQNIYHGDIKPDNILYDSISQTFKFTDFGAAVKFENTHKFNETVHTFGDIREATPPYMAPEIIWASSRKLNIEDFKFGKIDIFSLGATIYSLIQKDFIGGDLILMKDDPGKYQLFLETIGNNMSNTFAAMKGRNIQESTEYRIKNLILKCMALNPKDRCSCDEIIEELESILK